jgi:hypothetical protein
MAMRDEQRRWLFVLAAAILGGTGAFLLLWYLEWWELQGRRSRHRRDLYGRHHHRRCDAAADPQARLGVALVRRVARRRLWRARERREVGRIFKVPVAPQDRPWMWASGHGGHIKRAAHSYEATREAAMAAFAKSWRCQDR